MLRTNQRNKGAFTGPSVARNFEDLDRRVSSLNARISSVEANSKTTISMAGTFSSGNVNMRQGVATVASGSNTISFAVSMSSGNYDLSCKIKNSAGEDVQYNEVSKTQFGFTILCADAGTLTYGAMEII